MPLGKLVSIIDDESDITELFQDVLCRFIEGISVVSFNDPAFALEHYRQLDGLQNSISKK